MDYFKEQMNWKNEIYKFINFTRSTSQIKKENKALGYENGNRLLKEDERSLILFIVKYM